MPYIKQEDREKLEPAVAALEGRWAKLTIGQVAGEFTYVVYRLAKRFSERYADRATGFGCLAMAMHELYRRSHAPYEDTKIKENGDV